MMGTYVGDIDIEFFINDFYFIFIALNLPEFFSLTLLFLSMLSIVTISSLPLASIADSHTIITTLNDEEDSEESSEENDNADFEQENSIQIRCAWDDALADGRLTYYISDEDSSEKQQEAVGNAIEKWDKKINPLELEESLDRKGSDIKVDFKRSNKQDIAGRTISTFDGYGLISKIEITIFKGTNDYKFSNAVIEQIAEHEMGHALGLGHANFDGNLMAALINDGTKTISACEIKGVYEANSWYLKDNDDDGSNTIPAYPKDDSITCDT
jgi:predicted Zn-dependent protease